MKMPYWAHTGYKGYAIYKMVDNKTRALQGFGARKVFDSNCYDEFYIETEEEIPWGEFQEIIDNRTDETILKEQAYTLSAAAFVSLNEDQHWTELIENRDWRSAIEFLLHFDLSVFQGFETLYISVAGHLERILSMT